MSKLLDPCGCFPTGRHYPGIADLLARTAAPVAGLVREHDAAQSWATVPFVVLDFETTGLDPAVDRVVEVGCACFANGHLTAVKNWLVNPGIPIPEDARSIHGISDADVADKPRFVEVVAELLLLLRGHVPCAYNADFDRRFLQAELMRAGHVVTDASPPAARPDTAWIDPLVWVRELDRYEDGHKLTDAAARYGVPLENAHRAADDAEAAGRVLLALAPRMPRTYGELVRIQGQYGARQDADYAALRAMRR